MTTHTPLRAARAAGHGPKVDIRSVHLDDPLVRPLIAELASEYSQRYSDLLTEEDLRAELAQYPAVEFEPPHGELLLAIVDDLPVSGGAFRRRHEPELGESARLRTPHVRDGEGRPAVPTAELKRIWTHSTYRRQGWSRRVLAELERRAAFVGYERIYLTTGPRQPEAAALYLSEGYTPLFDPDDRPTEGGLAFEKWLSEPAFVRTAASQGADGS